MSHGDEIDSLGNGFEIIAKSSNDVIAAIHHKDQPLYGVQFHPEVMHTLEGETIISNFSILILRNVQQIGPLQILFRKRLLKFRI